LEVLDAFLDGSLTVKRRAYGTAEIMAYVDAIEWKKRLNVTMGDKKSAVRSHTHRLTTDNIGFE
jgi:hypothetical protein